MLVMVMINSFICYKKSQTRDKLIKDRLLEHITFVRGVHETGNEENINNILRRNG